MKLALVSPAVTATSSSWGWPRICRSTEGRDETRIKTHAEKMMAVDHKGWMPRDCKNLKAVQDTPHIRALVISAATAGSGTCCIEFP